MGVEEGLKKSYQMLKTLPQSKSVDAAVLLYNIVSKTDGKAETVPSIAVFNSEEPGKACSRLYGLMTLPDQLAPCNNPEVYLTAARVVDYLSESKGLSLGIALFLLNSVAEKADQGVTIYADLSRIYQEHIGDWREKLIKQFGSGIVNDLTRQNHPLMSLMKREEQCGRSFSPHRGLPYYCSPRRIIDLIRGYDINEYNRICRLETQSLEERLPYIERVYSLRGLEFHREYYFWDSGYPKPNSSKDG